MPLLIKRREKMSEKEAKKYPQLSKNPWVFSHVETVREKKFRNQEAIKDYILDKHGEGTYLVLEKPEGQGPFRKVFYEELGRGEV